MPYNCTNVELKSIVGVVVDSDFFAYNCTNVELKYGTGQATVPISPTL